MENKEFFQTSNGLRVCYIQKKNFHKSYAGIGLNYGSRDLEFFVENQKMKSKKGVAHFIEHKLYQMPDGDAFLEFSKMNASANAYTDLEKTIYYFTTVNDLYAPLELLLKMFFTPYFKEKDVEREKGIITSEIKMVDDIPQAKFTQHILNALYPRSSLSVSTAGTVESVKSTTVLDLELAYRSFYTTDNSFLVIISYEPREKVIAYVEDLMKSLKVNRGLPKLVSPVTKKMGTNFTFEANVEQTTASLAIRFQADQNSSLFCEFIIGLLDTLLSPSAPFYKQLHQQKAFTADIEYSVSTLRDTAYAVISTTSSHPKVFLDAVEEKLKNLKKSDLYIKMIDIYLKHLKAKSILSLDSIEELGEEILILALEGESYLDNLNRCLDLKRSDFYSYIHFFNEADYIQAICKKSAK